MSAKKASKQGVSRKKQAGAHHKSKQAKPKGGVPDGNSIHTLKAGIPDFWVGRPPPKRRNRSLRQ